MSFRQIIGLTLAVAGGTQLLTLAPLGGWWNAVALSGVVVGLWLALPKGPKDLGDSWLHGNGESSDHDSGGGED